MKRLCAIGVLGLLLAATGGRLEAQYLYFNLTYPDTDVAVPIGHSRSVDLYLSSTTGVGSYNITLFFDPRVTVTAVDTVPGWGGTAPNQITLNNSVPGQATISASGGTVVNSNTAIANVTFTMADTATSGSLVSMRVNSLTDVSGADLVPTHTTELLDLWQAVRVWGDIDSSFTVTSRDALIALTAAVGLSTAGFNLATGDVDQDSVVTSRDALFILSYAVGYTGQGRTGLPIPNRGPPLAAAPQDFAFFRNSAIYTVAAGDTLANPVNAPAVFTGGYGVSWSPDGSTLLATKLTASYGYEVVGVNVASGAIDSSLVLNTAFDAGGVYSPDGLRIAFVSGRVSPAHPFVMQNDGTLQTQIDTAGVAAVTSSGGYTRTAWDTTAAGLNYIVFSGDTTGGGIGLYQMSADSIGTRAAIEVFPNSTTLTPYAPAWSPGGDSVVFVAGSSGQLYRAAAPTDAGTAQIAARLAGTLDWPAWTAAGIWFRRYNHGRYDYYYQQPNGRILRVSRGTSADLGMGVR